MKRKIFRRIFFLYGLVVFLAVVFINFYITGVVRSNYINSLKKSLAIQASLISEGISFHVQPGRTLDNLSRAFKKKTDARITLINAEGKVLGDSDQNSSLMENHGDRPEIQQSLVSESGWSIRHSDTLRYDLLYVAKKVVKNKQLQGFIRLSVPLSEIDTEINPLRLKINSTIIVFFIMTGILLIWQTERIRKLVMQIIDYSGALAHGLFGKRLFLKGAEEFTELAQNLNDMASELESSIQARDEETNRLNVILKSIPDALLLINMNGMIELSNYAARELFAHHMLDNKPFIEVVRNPEFSELIETVQQTKMPGSVELIIDLPEEKFMTVRVSPLSYKVGELAGVVAIFHDTTHLRRLEQIRKDFVANVSHEIKTPVTAIKGFAETLLDGAIHERENAQKFLNTIKSHSERLNRLVEDLLTLSKIELGVIKIQKTEVNIADTIDKVIHTLAVKAGNKGVALRKSHAATGMLMKADRDKAEQILLNLVDNAIKFTEKGEIEIGTAQEGEKKYLFVRDSGIGIPRKYLPRLGERFFRVDPSRSRELGGTGLGLAIVKHLVKAHGWEMKIESEVGEGTIIRIFLEQG